MPPIHFNPIQPSDLDTTKDPTLAVLNQKYQELVDTINQQMGVNGPVKLLNHLDMGGNEIQNLGAPSSTSGALSQKAADPLYSTATQQKAMEAVGQKMLQTTRRLNDGQQQHKTSSDLNSQGSLPPTIVGSMTYTSTATTITWTWTGLIVQFGDLSTRAIKDGTLLITGLSNATQYFFYPYWDTQTGQVVFVPITGTGTGSPPCAFTTKNSLAGQIQNSDGKVPLSISAMSATTGTSGGGGGSGCIRAGMHVFSRSRAEVPIESVTEGEEIRSVHGWTKVIRKTIGSDKVFIRIFLSTSESVIVTPSHPMCLFDGTEKPAQELTLLDVLLGMGATALVIRELAVIQGSARTVCLACDPAHEFVVGSLSPTVAVHNYIIPK
jgi:hypothetical protein